MVHSKGRRSALLVATALLQLLWSPAVRDAVARVDPLSAIKQQIQKANMLIVLDTSGSMVSVPGGTFSSATEAGIDCDDGYDCRQGLSGGSCAISGRTCIGDGDCQASVCQVGGERCETDLDCPPQPQSCTLTGAPCNGPADCPQPSSGLCSATGAGCSATTACATVGKCETGGAICTNVGDFCPDQGVCSWDPTILCTDKLQCPVDKNGGGSCDSHGGPCSADNDCTTSQCSQTSETCAAGTCPENKTKGYCTGNPTKACNSDNNCRHAGTCFFPPNQCVATPSFCKHPHSPCQVDTKNECRAVANTCVYAANVCQPAATNACIAAAPGDLCQATGTGTGPIRMCRIAQTVCSTDKDCKGAGDSCGPASSRAVIAKRVLRRVVLSNSNIVNFGLMTFWQGGYYPYFNGVATTGTSSVVTVSFGREELIAARCYTGYTVPAASCTIKGITYARRGTPSSRYRIRTRRGDWSMADQDWCGDFCPIKPGFGTGEYAGTYYTYDTSTPGTGTTLSVQESYLGKQAIINGEPYTYYQPNPRYYNGGARPPIEVADCTVTNACGLKCGGRWDTQLAPFLDTSGDPTIAQTNALAIAARMEKASTGGLITYWDTPSGCTLENSAASATPAPERYSAYHYMAKVKSQDALPCRNNFVLFVTDGAANGPGDVHPTWGTSLCDKNACAAADPEAAGCTCRAVLAAWHMRKNLGVRTFVVGFSGNVQTGSARIINDNIARAGGTDAGADGVAPFAFLATSEGELSNAIQDAIYEAVKGSYATSPATASSGVQLADGFTSGEYVLDSRVDFPSWKGHLLAYTAVVSPTTLAWDAAVQMEKASWWERRIYVGGPNNSVTRVAVDPVTKTVTNRAALRALGLGSTDDEAEAVARWMMGDPEYKNPAVLGAIVNSTPIDVGQPGDNPLPGGHAFYTAHKTRPRLTYVGADDGMLHAFFTEKVTVGGTTYSGGDEAFAFIPQEMTSVITRLYAQGGQKADPDKHIFGLASSPKVKNVCVAGCADPAAAVWKTLLVMGDGFGGTELFVLDITDPITPGGAVADPPVRLVWTTATASGSASYDEMLGQTISVPAFYFKRSSDLDDYRLIHASGYAPLGTAAAGKGASIVISSVKDGTIINAPSIPSGGGCSQELTLLTDVATARDFSTGQGGATLLTGYFGDTWGNLWRYPGSAPELVTSLGCSHPLHFSPAVVQLDRDDPSNRSHEVYLVQVTNSSLDDVTRAYPPSQMVIMKETVDRDGNALKDLSFGTSGGKITLTVGQEVCAIGDEKGCTMSMPLNARPAGTPLAVLKADGNGFQILSTWYVPPAGCGKGTAYLAIHEVSLTSKSAAQKQALQLASEPVIAPVAAGDKLLIVTSSGARSLSTEVASVFMGGKATPGNPPNPGVFSLLGWQELL